MTRTGWMAVVCVAALLLTAGAVAQRGHGGGPGGGGGGGRMGGGGMGMPGGHAGGGMGGPGMGSVPRPSSEPHGGAAPSGSGGSAGTNRAGLKLGPPARWWDDKAYSQQLGLNKDQQKRMDGVFAQNREALLQKYETLKQAQTRLEKLTKSEHPDETALFSEIDKVAQARADLEKANTRMLLQLRGEMTPSQIEKLEEQQR